MNKQTPTFESYVVRGVLANNEFGIISVNELHSIKSLNLHREEYPFLQNLIREEKIDEILNLPMGTRTDEYLEIMKFKDQNQKNYIVTVYSSDELSQDPQVADIFSLGSVPE